ncbi:MAG: putative RNA uridine N3 methyltransferase [Candidatus Thorarchaeota archaeon]|jgi:predicted SPOUT superfamily RNA methylase MTH1
MPLEIAIPDTSLSDCSNLRQKTIKIGQIARALAVFKVEKVLIYETESEEKERRDLNVLDKLLRYMDTPQYLRRAVFSMAPSLKYAGILPPLRTNSHPLGKSIDKVFDGEVRWGIQAGSGKIDIGLKETVDYPDKVSTRVPTLFQIKLKGKQVRLRPITRDSVDQYFGFDVETTDNIVDYLQSNMAKTRIAFSRKGTIFSKIESEIESVLTSSKSMIAILGGPQYGIRELLAGKKDALKESVDFWVNTITDQGTETVRVEEALWASLAMFNSSFGTIVTKPGFHIVDK